jgi:hypothetical protein
VKITLFTVIFSAVAFNPNLATSKSIPLAQIFVEVGAATVDAFNVNVQAPIVVVFPFTA